MQQGRPFAFALNVSIQRKRCRVALFQKCSVLGTEPRDDRVHESERDQTGNSRDVERKQAADWMQHPEPCCDSHNRRTNKSRAQAAVKRGEQRDRVVENVRELLIP